MSATTLLPEIVFLPYQKGLFKPTMCELLYWFGKLYALFVPILHVSLISPPFQVGRSGAEMLLTNEAEPNGYNKRCECCVELRYISGAWS